MLNSREVKEQRIFGASFVCARTSRDGTSLLLVADSPKKEVSAGLAKWVIADQPALCYPGGGRSVNQDGTPETREETLQIELQEETALALSIAALASGLVQKFPFVVAQEKSGKINQIAVTTVLYWFDAFGLPEQKFITDMCARGKAEWLTMQNLLSIWSKFVHSDSNKTIFRPQVLTTAYLWSLDLLSQWSDEAILLETNKLNIQTAAFIKSESRKSGLTLQNGGFRADGSVLLPSELNSCDAMFLYNKRN